MEFDCNNTTINNHFTTKKKKKKTLVVLPNTIAKCNQETILLKINRQQLFHFLT